MLIGDDDKYIIYHNISTHAGGARASPEIVLVGCWAHIYRRFKEASQDHLQAEYAMAFIRWLYGIDEHAPPGKLGEMRARWSKLVLDEH